jgi:hypothetical protein
VTKTNASGHQVSVQIAGAGVEALVPDAAGNVNITGSTGSVGAPIFVTTPGAYESSPPSVLDAFACELSGTDGHPLFCTFLDVLVNSNAGMNSASGFIVDLSGNNLSCGPLRPVVLDTDFVPIGTRSFDMNPDLGNNARFLASVERIVDSLFNRRQESFSRIIEAKQVPVLRENFADGYVALFCRHRLGRDGAALWLFTGFVDVRHICAFFHFAGLYFGIHDGQIRTRCRNPARSATG